MIERIRLANLGPFGGIQDVVLPEGLISIEGRYVGAKGKSNRAGKSFFAVDLLRFLFFGKHRYSQNKNLPHRSADLFKDPIYAAAHISIGEQEELTITRTYDALNKRFALELPGYTERSTDKLKQSEMQAVLEASLGCDHETAALTWMVMQDESSGIMKMSVSSRKTFLLTLFSPTSYSWDAYYAEVMQRLKIVQGRYSELQGQYAHLLQKQSELHEDELLGRRSTLQQLCDEYTAKKEHLSLQKAELQKRLADKKDTAGLRQKLANYDSTIQTSFSVITSTRKQIGLYEKQKIKRQKATQDYEQIAPKLLELDALIDPAELAQVREDYTKVARMNQRDQADLAAQFDRINNIMAFQGHGKACPVTGNSCPHGTEIDTYLNRLTHEASQLEQRIKLAEGKEKKLLQQLTTIEAYIQERDLLDRQLSGVQTILTETAAAEHDLVGLQELLKDQEAHYKQLKQERQAVDAELTQRLRVDDLAQQRQLQEYTTSIQEMAQEIVTLNKEIALVDGDLQYLQKLEKDLTLVQAELHTKDEQVQVLKALRPALSKDGIPFFNLVASISEFETEINRALSTLGTDIRVEVLPYRTMTTKEPMCMTCGYEFTNSVTKCPVCKTTRQFRKEETLELQFKGSAFNIEFSEDSGGGKLLVSLAVRLALFTALRDRGYMRGVDWWVMDEVFSPLDTAAKAAMLNFLDDLRDLYGFKQLFIISHTDLSDVIPPAIIIERDADTQSSVILA